MNKVHTKRHSSNAVKALSKKHYRVTELTVSGEALRLIGEIFHLDKSWKSLSFEERLHKRQTELKPKTDVYFEWVESKIRNSSTKIRDRKRTQVFT